MKRESAEGLARVVAMGKNRVVFLLSLSLSACQSGDQSTAFLGRDKNGSYVVEVRKSEVAGGHLIKAETSRLPATAGRKPNEDGDPNLNVVEAVSKAETKVVAAVKAEKKEAKKIVPKEAAKPADPEKAEKKESMQVSVRKASDNEPVYIVQIGIFKVKANAEALVKKLKDLGFPVIAREESKPMGEVTVVRMEPTPNKSEAEQWVKDLKEKAGLTAVISKK